MSEDVSGDDVSGQVLRVLQLRDLLGSTVEEALQELVERGQIPADPDLQDEILRRIEVQATRLVRIGVRIPRNRESDWPTGYDTSKGFHWLLQKEFLRDKINRTEADLDHLDLASGMVLEDLGYPTGSDDFDIRGLVIGQVQSGKTQNFSAVIAKALDAGYRIVVVLSGMTDDLRNQTQRRLMRDLGADDVEGVGVPDPENKIFWETNLGMDFDPGSGTGSRITPGAKHIFVVKKQRDRLSSLIDFLEGHLSEDTPLLVIDDESDQASVDTGKHEVSTISNLVSDLVELGRRVSYVGYTATPAAPVLTDREAFGSLFPRDFIDVLPEPETPPYTGATALFGNEALIPIEGWFRKISNRERDSINDEPSITAGLRSAVRSFFLASACRIYRAGTEEVPCIMLVHTAHLTDDHGTVLEKLGRQVDELRTKWETRREETEKEFAQLWSKDFAPWWENYEYSSDPPNFEALLPALDSFIWNFTRDDLMLVNSKPGAQPLNFDETPNLKAIITGGNKLSRGITVEGLLVSYFARTPGAQDTLHQMERWLGYRGDYLDLTRIYTTEDLRQEFEYIAKQDADWRAEFIRAGLDSELKPGDIPTMLKVSPLSALTVTGPAKMRKAREDRFTWAGMDEVTQYLPFNVSLDDSGDGNEKNLEATRAFISGLGEPESIPGRHLPAGLPAWAVESPERVLSYLDRFQADPRDYVRDRLTEYIRRQNAEGELTHWFVVVAGRKTRDPRLEDLDLHIGGGEFPTVHTVKRTRQRRKPEALGGVWDGNACHEAWGLTDEQFREAEDLHVKHGRSFSLVKACRSVRASTEALLVVYPVSRFSAPTPDTPEGETQLAVSGEPAEDSDLMALGMSFPHSSSPASYSVITTTTGDVRSA